MTVKQIINNYEFMDFHIGVYINNLLIMIGTVDDINRIATGYILNARLESYEVRMIGELHIYIKL